MKLATRQHNGWPMLTLIAAKWAVAIGPPWGWRTDDGWSVEPLPRIVLFVFRKEAS